MIKKIPVKLDPVGRVTIPKNIRKMYNIESGTILSLTLKEDEILFTTSSQEENKLLNKIKLLEKYNLEFIITKDQECIYETSQKSLNLELAIKEALNQNKEYGIINTLVNNQTINYYYVVTNIDKYTNYLTFIKEDITKKDKILTICNLLS